jgi:transposase
LAFYERQKQKSGNFKYFLNSWQFYTLRMFITYKAEYKYQSMQVVAINPAYTSQNCSRCHSRNKTMTKDYKCSNCNLKEHRDINAAKNIAQRGRNRIKEHIYSLFDYKF